MALTGDKVTAVATITSRQNPFGDVSSTIYVATLTGGTTCSAVFVAPPSGAVIVHIKYYGYNAAPATNYNFCSYEVRLGGTVGAGTLVQAAADTNCIATSHVSSKGIADTVEGLTPGATYNVRMMFRVDGSTGRFINKVLIVQPQI